MPSCNPHTCQKKSSTLIMRSFNTASGNAQLQHGTIAYIHSDVLSFNTASGNAQLQQCLCVKPENYVGFGFKPQAVMPSCNQYVGALARNYRVSIPQAVMPSCNNKSDTKTDSGTCFNTASGNAQLQQ